MTSSRNIAIFSAVLLALLLWLRPFVGRMGSPTEKISTPLRDEHDTSSRSVAPSSIPAGPAQHLDGVATAILNFTNVERSQAGLRPLQAEARLAELATAHSDDMLARNFFDHVNPDGDGSGERVANGHRQMIGTSAENIWMGSGFATDDVRGVAEQIVRNWMGSQGHRENILRPELTHLGVGVSLVGSELRATQLFGNISGYLDEAVPDSLPPGSSPRLSSRPYGDEPSAVKVDLFADGHPIWGPRSVTAARLDVKPGDYRLRFYLPKPDGYKITYGPALRIKL